MLGRQLVALRRYHTTTLPLPTLSDSVLDVSDNANSLDLDITFHDQTFDHETEQLSSISLLKSSEQTKARQHLL